MRALRRRACRDARKHRARPEGCGRLRVRLTTACAGVEHLLGRHADAYGRLVTRAGEPRGRRLSRSRCTDDRTRDGRRVPDGVRADRHLGPPSARDREAARRSAADCERRRRPRLGRGPVRQGFGGGDTTARRLRHSSTRSRIEELALRLDAAINLAGAELYLDRFDETGVHAERVVAVARATGQPAVVVFAFMLLAWARMLRGELADGGEMLDGADRGSAGCSATPRAWPGCSSTAHSQRSRRATQNSPSARPRRASSSPARMDNGLIPAATGLALAAARLETGDPGLGDAVELLLERTRRRRATAHAGGQLPREVARATHTLLAGAGPPRGRRTRRCVRRDHRSLDGGAPYGDVDGRSRRSSHRPCLRRRGTRRPIARSPPQPRPTTSACRSRLRSHARSPAAPSRRPASRERAVTELERAADAFHACGARRYRDAADHELRRLGRRVHRRTQPGQADAIGVGALTEREQQVARLVVDRRTNPRDRRNTVPQPQDRRDAHAEHLPQTRRLARASTSPGPSSVLRTRHTTFAVSERSPQARLRADRGPGGDRWDGHDGPYLEH